MRLKSIPLAISILLLFFGGISLSTALNWWQTESSKVPVTFTEGSATGQYNPADIRGSYTFGEISELFAIPLADFKVAFKLPGNTDVASYLVKSLEELYVDLPFSIGTDSVRLFVAFYKGLPIDLMANEDTYIFKEGADILVTENSMLPEQASFLKDHTIYPESLSVTPATIVPEPGTDQALPLNSEPVDGERKITGKTTFQQLLDWGVDIKTIESILGEPMPQAGMVIKDYLNQNGLEFLSIKDKLQSEVNSLP